MSWRAVRLLGACGVLVVVSGAPACGGNASDPNRGSGSGGSGGSGSGARAGNGSSGSSIGRAGSAGTAATPEQPTPIRCGSARCSGVVLPAPISFPIPGCCADASTNHCGLDSSVLATVAPIFSEACQPLAQPGTIDASCPVSPKVPLQDSGLTIDFPGCCRPDHTCGYMLDSIAGVFKVGLGCVDSSPFLDGGTPATCGETGAAGAAGAAGDGSGAGAGGDSSGVGGTAGDTASAGVGG